VNKKLTTALDTDEADTELSWALADDVDWTDDIDSGSSLEVTYTAAAHIVWLSVTYQHLVTHFRLILFAMSTSWELN